MPTLHLLCGKLASGKSTLAKNVAAQRAALICVPSETEGRVIKRHQP